MAKTVPDQDSPLLIVAIGASAGGVNPLREFLAELGEPRQISFILVQHLGDGATNLAHDVLAHQTALPVFEIKSGLKIRAGHIYHAPAHSLIDIKDGVFEVTHAEVRVQQFTTIDHMMASVAKAYGERAVGIVLSGVGSDGTQGLKELNQAGGMTIAQDPESAEFPPMPQSAIANGTVDHILTAKEIPDQIRDYVQYIERLLGESPPSVLQDQIKASLDEICDALLKKTRHDFKHYKTSTLVRRVQRRMQVLQISNVNEYAEKLSFDPKESDALFKELLINVTSFFRDPEAFECLKAEVLAPGLEARKPGEKYRIWVAGCSTGEEVYSIAILVRELMATMTNAPEVQIIATDIDDEALSIARRGTYSVTIAEHVSPERLKTYFTKKGGKYLVAKELREIVLFSVHNLINDPPFSQLDLISCRNVMIYLGSHLQKKLIPVFHYALRPGGSLFLGSSETLTTHKELFKTVSAKYRIGQRKQTAIHSPQFSTKVQASYAHHSSEAPRNHESDIHLVAQRIVLDEFTPRYAVVNDDCQVVSVSAGLSRYLEPTEGAFQNNLMKFVKPSLRVGLRNAFHESKKAMRQVTHSDSMLSEGDSFSRVGITVQPMPHLGDEAALFMVVFHDYGPLHARVAADENETGGPSLQVVEQLEKELSTLRTDLDRTVQDLEASNEELKSSNEELLSMNEELQSANEELETSKEDVQDANDALQKTNNDLENLITSTEIATLFLSEDLKIQSFTPQLDGIYNVVPGDVGRPIAHITSLAKDMPPLPDPRDVVPGRPIETDLQLKDGRWILRRISSYRTTQGTYSGMVVVFIDVTHLRVAEQRYRELADSMPNIVWTANADGKIDYFNRRWYEFTGGNQVNGPHTREELIHPDDLERAMKTWDHSIKTGKPYEIEFRYEDRVRGGYRWFLGRAIPARDAEGKIVKWYGSSVDIDDRTLAQQTIVENERRLETMIQTSPSFMATLNASTLAFEEANERYLDLIGHRDIIGKKIGDALPEVAEQGFIELLKSVADSGEPHIGSEAPVSLQRTPTGGLEVRYVDFVFQPANFRDGKAELVFVHGVDVTEKVLARRAIEQTAAAIQNERENFRNLFKQTPEMVCILSGPEHVFEFVNEAHVRVLGFDATGMPVRKAQPESIEVHGLLDEVYRTGKTAELNEIPVTIGNRLRYFNLTYAARHNDNGEINGVMILGLEVTEQLQSRIDLRSARDEAERQRKLAESANESKTRFLANMSHEIRTPLAAILGYSELLKGHTAPGDNEAAAQLDRVSRNASQLGRLIDELLDLSKIEADKFEIDPTAFDLHSAIEDTLASVSLLARQKGLIFETKFAGSVPRQIVTDQMRFKQILTNIIGNSVKFTETGRVDVEFKKLNSLGKTYLQVRVTDTGIGLSPEQGEKLFEPFVQADNSVTRKFGGTGLGLSLSRRLARLLGGELVLEKSALGQGSTFTLKIEISLPDGHSVHEAAPAKADQSAHANHRLDGVKILIVDDSIDNQTILRLFLTNVGAKVELANNGLEGVEKMKTNAYDVVLMDIQMPMMDGYQALKVANQSGYRGPIVALTAHALKEEKERCLAAGFTDYMSKPVNRTALIQRLIQLRS